MKQYRTIKTLDEKADFAHGKKGASAETTGKQEYTVCNLCQKEKGIDFESELWLVDFMEDVDICFDCQTVDEKEKTSKLLLHRIKHTHNQTMIMIRDLMYTGKHLKEIKSKIDTLGLPCGTWSDIDYRSKINNIISKTIAEIEGLNIPF